MMRLYRRIRIAFAAAVMFAVVTDEPLIFVVLGAYVAVVTYATGDAWLCERERRSVSR